VARLSEDQATAFDAFVGERRDSLLRTAFLLTGDRGRAEDLVQAALMETFRRWPRLRERTDPVGYARKALVSRHIDTVRRRSSREVPIDFWAEPGADRLAIRAALLDLPPRMRAVLVLRFFDDLTEASTAALLGCSIGTVKSTAARGLARLREVLADHDPRPSQPAVWPLSALATGAKEDER
jgi:RNA polymerase sigma-70 factor (sigma-E family)